jgi:long-subunit fatty acid transport protein
MKLGAQFRDSDGGDNSTSPFFEGALRSQVNEQFSVRAFARYSMEDWGTSFRNYYYDLNDTFRLGVSADYIVSPMLTLHAGANYIMTDLQEASVGGISDLDQDLWNLSLGFSYKINDAFYVTGSYNYTDSSSSGGTNFASDSRSYAQNRASLGIRMEF